MTQVRSGLAEFMVINTDVTAAHETGNADGIDVANRFVGVHVDGIELIRRHAVREGQDDRALVMLGVHVLNVYTSVVEFAIRGRFDVAWLLGRAMFDGRSLAYAVAKDSYLAAQFLDGKLKASEARKFTLEDLAATGYSDLTGGFEDRWKRNAEASNTLAHVNVSHLGMITSAEAGEVVSHYGGHSDLRGCRLVLAAMHEHELWFLTTLEHLRRDALPSEWSQAFLVAKVGFGEFRKKYESEWNSGR